MKRVLWFGLGILATVVLVAGVLVVGWVGWGRGIWSMPMHARMGTCDAGAARVCEGDLGPIGGDDGTAVTLAQAQAGFQRYVDALPEEGLELADVMEFEHNFYAIVADAETGIGYAELLADKVLGRVSPEMGPNMMWGTGSMGGMHRGMRTARASGAENQLSEDEALDRAQVWLDDNRPGVLVEEHADPFAGYYTIHTLRDDGIEGMLSVHGSTGQVWYHSWHGDFVAMLDLEDHD